MQRKILIGYDLSAASDGAIQWIQENAVLQSSDDITLATIINDDILAVEGFTSFQVASVGGGAWIADEYNDRMKKMTAEATKILQSVADRFAQQNIHVTCKILKGQHAGETLQQFAEENDINLVIVGSRGLGFLKRKLLGSVSEHLSLHLKCSVLIVREREKEQS